MTQVSVTKKINSPASFAWAKITDFGNVADFIPGAKSSSDGSHIGAVRNIEMGDGAKVQEKLTVVDNADMKLQYDLLSGPFPLTNYVGTFKVDALDDNSCDVTWSSTFDMNEGVPEAAMIEPLEGLYNASLETLGSLKASS